jgi:hypothetical protein
MNITSGLYRREYVTTTWLRSITEVAHPSQHFLSQLRRKHHATGKETSAGAPRYTNPKYVVINLV